MRHNRLFIVVCLIVTFALGVAFEWIKSNLYVTNHHSATIERTFALNVVNSAIPAWNVATQQLKQVSAGHPGLKVEFGGPTDGDASKQIEQLHQLVQRSISGLIICPADSASLTPTINEAYAKNIPTVTLFSDVPESKRILFISADERKSAYRLAHHLVTTHHFESETAGTVSVMAIITKPGLEFAEQRLAGIKDACSEYKALKLVNVTSNEWSEKKGAEQVTATLHSYPNLRIVFGLDSRAAIGAVTALKEQKKKPGDVIVSGWDTDRDVLDSISEGWVASTSAPNMSYMVQLAVSVLDGNSLGYLYPVVFHLKEHNISPIPSQIDISQTIIEKDNVQAYLPVN